MMAKARAMTAIPFLPEPLFSPEFARAAALVLNANGIRTYLTESLRPTPELSFGVRELGCIAGVMITASHNPREYNGYKVYWEDGGQITPPHDKGIMDEVEKLTDVRDVRTMDEAAEGIIACCEGFGIAADHWNDSPISWTPLQH